MNTEQLRYFQLAYKQGSFSAAARMVPVSHQGLTKGIRNLERELGVTLFDYDSDSGRPEPTPFAHELYDFAVAYEANLHLLKEALIYSGETTRAVAPDAPATCGDVSHVV